MFRRLVRAFFLNQVNYIPIQFNKLQLIMETLWCCYLRDKDMSNIKFLSSRDLKSADEVKGNTG